MEAPPLVWKIPLAGGRRLGEPREKKRDVGDLVTI
jgi:hypothetical protein